MRRLATIFALASTALATPAVAQDNGWYAGVEGGLMIVEDADFDVSAVGSVVDNSFSIDHKRGLDLDIIGGYDFGMIRAEVEAGYKRASVDQIDFSRTGPVDASGNARVYSVMGNLLLDFTDPASGWSGYVGPGIGLANVRYRFSYPTQGRRIGGSGSDSDRSSAFQGIAGVRKSLSPNIDLGLKYRFFVARDLDYDIIGGSASGKYRSHSLLASLVYNFAPPPPPPVVVIETPPPPPPPPPPATQTCYDGSVILATDVCPQPPAPPPPPAPEPAPERG